MMEIQRRERVVLVSASQGGVQCPDTTQVRPCPLLAGSCRQPAWDTGPWSNCSLPAGLTCGEGVRSRELTCSRAGLVSLPLTDCLASRVAVPGQHELCHVDCSDQDCVLGQWSAWSHCPHQHCGETRTRTRSPMASDQCSGSHLVTRQVSSYWLTLSKLCPWHWSNISLLASDCSILSFVTSDWLLLAGGAVWV